MNDDAALSVATVAACISMLSDSIATLPLNAYKRTKDKTRKIVDPTPPLIANPWPEGTLQDFLSQVMVSLTLRGNFYGRICDRDSRGYPTIIMPVHPDRVMARRDRDSGKRVYRFDGAPVPLQDVVHIPSGMLTPGSFIGMNPVEYQRQSWSLAAAAEKYGSAFFSNSANPSVVIEVPGDLSTEETVEMARNWKMDHQGIGNAQMPGVMTGGATIKALSIAPDDAQFLQTRTYQREVIISWFRIPPHKIGITDRTPGPTLTEELEMMFVTDALLPWANRIEAYFSAMLPPSQVCKFDFSSRVRGNRLQRMQSAQISANTGIEMIDEIRDRDDLPPLPNGLGQVIARPTNMQYFDTATGDPITNPKPAGADNSGGFGGGGGNPDGSPDPTKPDALNP